MHFELYQLLRNTFPVEVTCILRKNKTTLKVDDSNHSRIVHKVDRNCMDTRNTVCNINIFL